MGSVPQNAERCGCGLLGENLGHDMNERYRSTEHFSTILSHENGEKHESHSWWCYECHRSHGECLTTGRQGQGRDEGDRCGFDGMLRRRQEAKDRRRQQKGE